MSKLPMLKFKSTQINQETSQKTPNRVAQSNNKENKLLNQLLDPCKSKTTRVATPLRTPTKTINTSLLNKLAHTPRNEPHVESHMKQLCNGNSVACNSSAKKYPNYLKSSSNLREASATPEKLNPIVNGVDYTEMMNKKEEYGYVGPGYIVEFTCDPKYLRGFVVNKGLWRAVTPKDYKPEPGCFDLGPPVYMVRIDMIPGLPPSESKILNYDFRWRSKYANVMSIDRSNDLKNASSLLGLERSCQKDLKAKKSIKWASDLVQTHDLSSISNSPATPTAHVSSADFPPKRKMRRSFSHSEINDASPSLLANDSKVKHSKLSGDDCDLKRLPIMSHEYTDDEDENNEHKQATNMFLNALFQLEKSLIDTFDKKRDHEVQSIDEFYKVMKSMKFIERKISDANRFIRAKGIKRF